MPNTYVDLLNYMNKDPMEIDGEPLKGVMEMLYVLYSTQHPIDNSSMRDKFDTDIQLKSLICTN